MTVTGFQPTRATDGEDLRLAMQKLFLAGRLLRTGARLVVRHVFASAEPHPLEIVYAFALPRDAALRRFRIAGEGFSVHSELRPVAEATRAYEEALEAGHLATLARQYTDGVVNLTVGNVRPGETITVHLEILAGVELRDDGLRFRFPFTIAPAYHAKARAVAVEPGIGEIELPEDEFGDLILPPFHAAAGRLHEVAFDLALDPGDSIEEIASPSHAIRVLHNRRVCLAPERDVPNRDLVLDVRTPRRIAVSAGTARNGRGQFAAVIPSTAFGEAAPANRRLVIVLDRSGSMAGLPIEQARNAIQACLAALSPGDLFSIIAFDSHTEHFSHVLVPTGKEARQKATEFLAAIDARGGTELAAAVTEAARLLGGEGGDILILTDGQVSGTENILDEARKAGARLHCLGIGSASQDRFLALLARQTGGVSRFLTPRERVDRPAVELFAAIGRPVAAEIRVQAPATLAPEPAPALFAGTPLVVYGETTESRLELNIQSTAGQLQVPVSIQPRAEGESLRLLRGARLLTDSDSEALCREFNLAGKSMALVAVVERSADQPGQTPQTVVVPVGLAQDVQFGGYFQDTTPLFCRSTTALFSQSTMALFSHGDETCRAISAPPAFLDQFREKSMSRRSVSRRPPPADQLLGLAAQIEPDGGMPGDTDQERLEATLRALVEFLAEGHTPTQGAFRLHVQRLLDFLENRAVVPSGRAPLLRRFLDQVRRGAAPALRPHANVWKVLAGAK